MHSNDEKLTRQALMKAGREVNKKIKGKIPIKTGSLKAEIGAKVLFDKSSGIPNLEIGYRNKSQMRKKGYKFYVNPSWFEFGTKPHQISTKEAQRSAKNYTYKLKDKQGREYGYVVNHPGMNSKIFKKYSIW